MTGKGSVIPELVRSMLIDSRRALERGDRAEARRLARKAVEVAPEEETPWLYLAAASEPRAGLAYAAKALDINPDSKAAREAVHWLVQRLPKRERQEAIQEVQLPEELAYQFAPLETLAQKRWVSWRVLLPALMLAGAFVIWVGSQPALARQPQTMSNPVGKATYTFTPSPTPTFTPTATPTNTPIPTETSTPTNTPTPRPNVSFVYSEDPTELADEGRWIDVDLSEQRVTAYEEAEPVYSFIVSTGTAIHPTVTGQFRIYIKLRSTPMSGPGYYLPGVPFTMYFYKGYALHGTYWHNNFGTPMSHGCVNLRTSDAELLFNFAEVGTLVNVHP